MVVSQYWIPGRQQLLASMPIPPNGTTTAKCDVDLMWLAGYSAQAHSVYFGTNKTAVVIVATTSLSPEFITELRVPGNIIEPPLKLKAGMMYYWRVDVHDVSTTVMTGHVWQFQCIDNTDS